MNNDIAPENAEIVNMYMNEVELEGGPMFRKDPETDQFFGYYNKKLIGYPAPEGTFLEYYLNFENGDVMRLNEVFIDLEPVQMAEIVAGLEAAQPNQIEIFYQPYIWPFGNEGNYMLGVITQNDGNIATTGMVCENGVTTITCMGLDLSINDNKFYLTQAPYNEVTLYKAPDNIADAYLRMLDYRISSTAKVLYLLENSGTEPGRLNIDFGKIKEYVGEGGKRKKGQSTKRRRTTRRRRTMRRRRSMRRRRN
jgi:hypothetical protein